MWCWRSSELKKFDKVILSDAQGFIRYAVFLRKLIRNLELSGYTAVLKSSNLTRLVRLKAPTKSTKEVNETMRAARSRLHYTQRLDAVPE